MLTMATDAGAAVADIEGIGSLSVGNHADIVMLSMPDMEGVPTGHSIADVLLKRARGVHVRSVMVGGKLMIEDGRWTGRSPEDLLEMLRANAPTAPPQPPRIALQLKDVVRAHLRTY
jgi:cytosine/adenosine deaminase-related metal-dependent hydrolase